MADKSGGCTTEVLTDTRCRAENEALREVQNFEFRTLQEQPARKSKTPVKKNTCKFFSMPTGCARGENCHYAHEGENPWRGKRIVGTRRSSHPSSKHGTDTQNISKSKKVFVSGLPPIVGSDDLYHFFEEKFGPVLDAIVIPNHSDDHSQGFGIVTFKSEDSVCAAIQARHAYISGKKIAIQVAYGRAAIPEGTAMARTESMKSLDSPCRRLFGESDQLPKPSGSLTTSSTSSPLWAQKLREWLPGFLIEVSKRLSEGEWYPLCSLKGDFRATCGMEIDHASLGYEKLADFIRSMPEICRVRIVPVGTGPATHIVLEKVPSVQGTSMVNGDSGRFSAYTSERNENLTGSGHESGRMCDAASFPETTNLTPSIDATLGSLLNIYNILSEGRSVQSSAFNNTTQCNSVIPLYYIGQDVFAGLPSPVAITFQPPIPQQESLSTHNLGLGSNGEMEATTRWQARQSWQASPQSTSSTNPEQTLPIVHEESLCMNCWEQRALWVAVPCGHRVLCTPCKEVLQNCQAWGTQCLVCQGYVQRWTALP